MKRVLCGRLAAIVGVLVATALLGALSGRQASAGAPARGENPRQYCKRVGNDDALRTPPRSLAGIIRRLFRISGKYAFEATYYRCADGDLLICYVGANLPCGKGNATKLMPAATAWCRTHENSDFIPMVVTGHDTIYSWRCIGRTATPGAPLAKLDSRGFFAENWKYAD